MSNCFTYQDEVGCFESSSGECTEVFITRKHGLDSDGLQIAPSVIYNDSAGNPVDVTGGTVTIGSCPLPHKSTVLLFELLADGTEQLFNRCVTIKTAPSGAVGTPIVKDYLTDYSAEYTVIDETKVFELTPKCQPLLNSGEQTTWANLK